MSKKKPLDSKFGKLNVEQMDMMILKFFKILEIPDTKALQSHERGT
jgi:hypothetical protein